MYVQIGQKSYFESLAGRQLLDKQPDSLIRKVKLLKQDLGIQGERGCQTTLQMKLIEIRKGREPKRKKEKDEKARTEAKSEQYVSSDILGKGDGDNLLAAVQTTFCHSTPLKACYVYVPCVRELSEIKINARVTRLRRHK